jgi:hypothetical protein
MVDPARNARHIVETYWRRPRPATGPPSAPTADDVVYEAPQTRERVRGKAAYVQFNAEYPGDWHLSIERAVGDERYAATWITFDNEGCVETGLCFFELDDDGLISRITDFWPEPYEPPPGRAHLVERW